MTIDSLPVPVLMILFFLVELHLVYQLVQAIQRHRRISSLAPSKIGDLQERSSSGTDWVAIEGKVACLKPLKSRYFGKTCVFYLSEIFDRQSWMFSHSGKLRQRQRHRPVSLFSKSEGVLFDISDETGAVLVDPRDAEVVSDQVSDFQFRLDVRKDRIESMVDPLLGKLARLVGVPCEEIAREDLKSLSPRRVKGNYLCTDTVVSVGDTLFVVGQLKVVSGRPILTSSGGGRGVTLLTNLSRASYLGGLRRQAWISLILILVCAFSIALLGYRLGTPF